MERTHRDQLAAAPTLVGSRDGVGAADNDAPFRFGRLPSARWTYPFTAWQYSRLLFLRGRIQDGEYADDRSD